ncbi:MAG: ChrR family anti-sigma-E factor [Pseudomonadota bacterium]
MKDQNTGAAFSELYSAYAAGCLDPAYALLVETQAALRADIQQSIVVSEILAGALLEDTDPDGMAADAVDQAMAAIDVLEAGSSPPKAALNSVNKAIEELLDLPAPLRDHALYAAGDEGWRFTGPGIRRLGLDVGSQTEIELYRLEPGASIPRHTHEGAELSLVVHGGFTDETGSYGPGDLSIKGPEHVHQPTADSDGPCIVLAVRDGDLKFQGVIGLVQRLMG